jgi:hypothetical protein
MKKDVNSKQKAKCTNCNNTRHSIKACWAKGGGAFGKAPDWWKELQDKKVGKSKGKSQDKANATKDSSSDSHSESVGTTIVKVAGHPMPHIGQSTGQ